MRYFLRLVCALALGGLPWMGCGGEGDSGVCGSFCAQDAKCYPPPEGIQNCVQYWNDLLGDAASVSAECETLYAELLACVADLPSCDQVDAHYSEDPPDSYPCKAEEDAVRSTCPGV
ncbi:MAG: hypothetical protein JSW51_04870 [Gemmatimonadota bacterium]|nr:MAG: hypothetical protein JSW51_04870 [Gemmatimonadota bacterium]